MLLKNLHFFKMEETFSVTRNSMWFRSANNFRTSYLDLFKFKIRYLCAIQVLYLLKKTFHKMSQTSNRISAGQLSRLPNLDTSYSAFTSKYNNACFRYYINVCNHVFIFTRKYNLLYIYCLICWPALPAC